jgi:uncharacterized protein YukE
VDGDDVRATAREVAALADEVRAVVARARRAAGADWQSVAAEAFRAELDTEIEHVLAAARAVDEVATALLTHAAAVEDAPLNAVAEVVRRLLP